MNKRYRVTFHGCCNYAGSDTETDEQTYDELPHEHWLSEVAYAIAEEHFAVEGWYDVEEIEE